MDIRSIVVNVDLDADNSAALRYAIDLAEAFDAELIGVAADEPEMTYGGIDGGAAAIEFYNSERAQISNRLAAAHEQFSTLVPAAVKSQWRASVAEPLRSLIGSAGCADVIITGPTTTSTANVPMRVNLGELVLTAGRPVIDVGHLGSGTKLDTIVIGWKDTREARRAVVDALPFLKRATEVVALTIGEGDDVAERDSLDDLLAWLGRHKVEAEGRLIDKKESSADLLARTARSLSADLLVTGGYGHSRVREWLFGGMTQSLLQANKLNRLFSN